MRYLLGLPLVLCLLVLAGCADPPWQGPTVPDHFWQEKRLAAVTEIAGACSDMSQCYFARAGKTLDRDTERRTRCTFDRREAQLVRSVNRHLPLLGVEFDKRLSLYIQLHRSLAEVESAECGKYLEMAAAVENAMDGVLRAALDGQPFAEPHLPLRPIPFKERIKMGPKEYLEKQYRWWQATQGVQL